MSLSDNMLANSEVDQVCNFRLFQSSLEKEFSEFIDENNTLWVNLINKTSLSDIPANSEIMSPVSPCEQLMVILHGSIRVYQHTPDDREVTLYRLGPGDLCVLSINGLLRRKSYGAFARTESQVSCLVFGKEQFYEAMAVSEAFRKYVLTSVSDRFNDLLELMETTVFESLDTRLICLLGKMSRTSSTDTIHITHQELARELGTSREVISRVLKGLERKGCISLARGSIRINM